MPRPEGSRVSIPRVIWQSGAEGYRSCCPMDDENDRGQYRVNRGVMRLIGQIMNLRLLPCLVLAFAASAFGQLQPPNAEGIAMGHVHLTVRDIDANLKFFKLLGGRPITN